MDINWFTWNQMACKNANNLSTKNQDYQFQVACVSYLNLKKTRNSGRKLINVCLLNLMLQRHNKWGKHWNKTITVSLILSCSTRTGSHSFSMCWLLLSIASLINKCVLINWVFKENKNWRHHKKIEDNYFDELSWIGIP